MQTPNWTAVGTGETTCETSTVYGASSTKSRGTRCQGWALPVFRCTSRRGVPTIQPGGGLDVCLETGLSIVSDNRAVAPAACGSAVATPQETQGPGDACEKSPTL